MNRQVAKAAKTEPRGSDSWAALLIDLPQPRAGQLQCGQPAAGTAARVNASQVSEVQHVGMRRVTHDGQLSRAMRSGSDVSQREPTKCLAVLPIQR
jgi:hypothetical protein